MHQWESGTCIVPVFMAITGLNSLRLKAQAGICSAAVSGGDSVLWLRQDKPELEQLLPQHWCRGLPGSGRALRRMQEVASRMAGASQSGLEGLSLGCQDRGCLRSC